jgi:hypothetical protein
MARGDNRRTKKTLRKIGQRKKKARLARKADKAKASRAGSGKSKSRS